MQHVLAAMLTQLLPIAIAIAVTQLRSAMKANANNAAKSLMQAIAITDEIAETVNNSKLLAYV